MTAQINNSSVIDFNDYSFVIQTIRQTSLARLKANLVPYQAEVQHASAVLLPMDGRTPLK